MMVQMFRLSGATCFYVAMITVMAAAFPASAQPVNVVDSLKAELQMRPESDTSILRPWLRLASLLRHSAPSEALIYGQKALRMADSINAAEAKGSALQILGLICTTLMDYRNSLYYSFQALRLYETIGAEEGKAFAYNAIGLVYSNMKKNDLAWRYFQKAIDEMKKLGNHPDLGVFYNNMGNILSQEKKVRESLHYYKMALEHQVLYGDSLRAISRICINIGDAYADLGMRDSSGLYLNRALKAATGKKPDLYAAAYCYLKLGKADLERNHIAAAASKLERSLNMAEKGGIKDMQIEIYQAMMNLYRVKNDAKRMHAYFLKYDALKDSVYSENTVNQINEMQEAYQVEKRDREIQLLQQKQKVTEAAATNQRLLRNFAIAGLLGLLLVALVVARNIVLKQRVKNRILSEKNAIAQRNIVQLNHENTLAKYEAMKSKTDPHFLFNSLTTLSSLVMDDPRLAVKYIRKFSNVFRMVLEVGDHKTITLRQELELIDSYIYLQKIRFDDQLDVSISVGEPEKHALLPPFALQLLVENAVKHNVISEQHPLSLRVYTEQGHVIVRNSLRKKSSMLSSTGTGQENIRQRYLILSREQPVFEETETEYMVKLPLLAANTIPDPVSI